MERINEENEYNLSPSILSIITKNVFKYLLLLFFFFTTIVLIDHFLFDEEGYKDFTFNMIENTIDKYSTSIENYFSIFDDIDFLVMNQKINPNLRNLMESENESDDILAFQEITFSKNNGENKSIIIENNSDVKIENNLGEEKENFHEVHQENDRNNIINNNETYYDFKYNLLYEFVKNITQFSYIGKWNNLKVNNNIFENIQGTSEVEILKNFTYPYRFNYISNIESIQALYFSIFLKDGDYRDNYINMNMTMTFPKNFSYYLYEKSENKKIILNYKNMTVKFIIGEIFGENNVTVCKESDVEIELIRSPKLLKKSFDDQMIIEFPEMNIQIRDHSCNFTVDLNLQVNENDNYENRIWNYSLIMTAISIMEIYLTLKLLYEVSENDQVGKNICLITLSMNIMWNSFLCTIHFYLSITNEDFSYEYGTPSMTYFLLFSIFELRLLFFVWRARYNHLAYTDLPLFRKKLLRFYSVFYMFLFVSLLSIRYIFTNFWSSYFLFASTWIFQIIHSIRNGTKPPFSIKYIFIVTLGKLFAPLYIKACPFNIFELKPAYWKMSVFVITILIEIGILALQKVVGPKFLLPSFLKKHPYNYYHDMENEEIRAKNENIECVICLDLLVKPIEEITLINEYKENLNVEVHARSIFTLYHKITTNFALWVESLKHTYKKKKFMITPCSHVFHTICMEKWMELKNECPYCRRPVPPLE